MDGFPHEVTARNWTRRLGPGAGRSQREKYGRPYANTGT
jgi:hypothetical protein